MSISKISVEGFRSIARLENLSFGPSNVLIGANGAGKSNLIQAFALMQAWDIGMLDEYVMWTGGCNRNLHFGTKVTTRLKISILLGNGKTCDISLEPTIDDRLGRYCEIIGYKRLDQWRVYNFHDIRRGATLLRTARLHDNKFLHEDGENLSAFLYYLKKKEKASYSRIQQTFRLATPFFDSFVLKPQALNERMIRLAWRHRISDAHLDISALSDGSLRFLALATLLLQPERLRPSVILLDEPELGLHPYATTLLCSLIQSVSAETQVILATQSPFLAGHFEPEDVIVVEQVDGRSEFRRLSTQKLKNWLEDYSLGNL